MADDDEIITLTTLSRKQRRVLGTLLEKAFTTPDQYPLTLKATIAGCNQKSNRDPVSNYDEDAVQQTLDELRELGLVGEVHTEGGRTSRFRHYMRRTRLPEPQLAIMTELMLRGRQQPGELRTRAGRLHDIDSLEKLRVELQGLIDEGLVRANGSLDRRGVEVDHNLYPPGENHEELSELVEEDEPLHRPAMAAASAPARPAVSNRDTSPWESEISRLKEEVAQLRAQLDDLRDQVDDLRRQLGA